VLFRFLESYLSLEIGKFKINCPYWINDIKRGIKGPFSGKGTPNQIKASIRRRLTKYNLKLESFNKDSLKKFLEANRIGIDCSGFVYHLLNQLNKEKGGREISSIYLKDNKVPAWRASWRVNADMLTSNKFTKKIRLYFVQPGDLIRLLGGKHVAIVVKVEKNFIIYAHCSNYTKVKGCHLGKIIIKDWFKNLEDQVWLEETENGESYKTNSYFPNLGDSLRRPMWLSDF